MNKILLFAILAAIYLNCGACYRILCPYPTISRSHFIVVESLLKGLAAKGHDVTVISAFPPDKPIPNYRHITIQLKSNHDEVMTSFTKNPGDMQISTDLLWTLLNITLTESHGMLRDPQVQKIMADEQFDLVIMEFLGEPHIGLSAHFNCPVVIFSSVKPSNRLLEFVGSPVALSYVGNPLFLTEDLSRFDDRLFNFFVYVLEKIVSEYFATYYVEFHNEYFPPPKYPSYNDVLKNNIAAVFITHHFSQGDVRPLVPGLIEISGIQMTETASPLPEALQEWMDKSTNGVVYFSLGSNLKVSNMAADKLAAIMYVCRKIKQNVLWKSDVPSLPGLPANVRLEKWVPQLDVLQHKNMRVFITHGGFGSITESKFYGIPVLVIPMFGDQIPNADVVVREGWGIKLPYNEFTEERLYALLSELIENAKYSDRAKYESMLYRDRPLTPLQTGIFWIEYIIRHKGAHHMRSNAIELSWYQLHSLDVIGFLSALLIIWVNVSWRILKCLGQKIFGSKSQKKFKRQ